MKIERYFKISYFLIYYYYYYFGCRVCGILVSQSGTEPTPTVFKVWSLNHWITREVPQICYIRM